MPMSENPPAGSGDANQRRARRALKFLVEQPIILGHTPEWGAYGRDTERPSPRHGTGGHFEDEFADQYEY